MNKELYDFIKELIPSNALKQKLDDMNYIIPEEALLHITDGYARNFAEETELFARLSEECDLPKNREYARRYREFLIDAMAEFEKNDGDFVYELIIEIEKDYFEDKFLCDSVASALELVNVYCEDLGISPEVISASSVVKRPLYKSGSDVDTSSFRYPAITLCRGNVIYRVETQCVDCDSDDCISCEKFCLEKVKIPPIFPRFAEDGDIISYKEYNGLEKHLYRISFHEENGNEVSEYVGVHLDAEADYSDKSIFEWHCELPACDADIISREELTKDELKNLKALEKLYKKMPEYKK